MLYFPKNQFSPRYGDQFYTIDLIGNDVEKDEGAFPFCVRGCSHHIEYKVLLKQGTESWTVKHRYNDFVELHKKLHSEFANKPHSFPIPELPPKTYLRVLDDQSFIITRQKELESFLDKVLSMISQKGLMLPTCLEEFLKF